MRARFAFETSLHREELVVLLKDFKTLRQGQEEGAIIDDVRSSIDAADLENFGKADKIAFKDNVTETPGVFSQEDGIWRARLIEPNVPVLQISIETLITQLTGYAKKVGKPLTLHNVHIVERGRKATIIEGIPLATRRDRFHYALSNQRLQFWIAIMGFVTTLLLLAATFPWEWRSYDWAQRENRVQLWFFSHLERLVGSAAITSVLAAVTFLSFWASLRNHTVKWVIPGREKRHEVRAQGV
jgi:hypothetical protein